MAEPNATTAARFNAAVPWIGPIVGAVPSDCPDRSQFRLAGAVDPALMRAFGAAFIPVIDRDDRFVPADRSGVPHAVQDVAWVQPAERDVHGWFRITAPIDRWQGKLAGVLVVMLYNESRELGHATFAEAFPDQSEVVLAASRVAHPQAKGARATYVPLPLPPFASIVEGIVEALERLLALKPAAELRSALSEVHDGTTSDDAVTFALGSCQYPTGLLEGEVACASYRRLARRLDARGGAERPQGLLLVGDQVYVDGTAGLFDPTAGFDRYVRPYEIFHRLDTIRDVTRRLPTYMLLDDHEIVDNWEPRIDDVRPDPMLLDGRRSYLKFERAAGPEPMPPVGDSTDPMWYEFALNGFPFFMADTRTERKPRTAADVDSASIMSRAQFARLREWLREAPSEQPKFVASPSILLPRHRRAIGEGTRASALRSDGWDGYPASLYRLLGWIAALEIGNVVFLSGDEHLSCVARATIVPRRGRPVVVHSVHSSALFAPFPFANSIRDDLAVPDEFEFGADVPGFGFVQAKCYVETRFGPPGDGFAVLRAFRKSAGSGWTLAIAFDRDPDDARLEPPFDYDL